VKTEAIAKSPIGRAFARALAAAMESRFRYRFFGPQGALRGAGIRPGQIVLEVGCGTGYYTLPAARLIGDQGHLVAMDVLPESVALVSRKVRSANLGNVRVVRGDALDTGLDPRGFDAVLLFGVIPSPMLPLTRLLPEMHRVLRADGTLAVWPPVPGWLPRSILRSELFEYSGKRNGVHRFKRCRGGMGGASDRRTEVRAN
jgi:ubiquinone/menaquinone biosynthesis C-methylase UbiE